MTLVVISSFPRVLSRIFQHFFSPSVAKVEICRKNVEIVKKFETKHEEKKKFLNKVIVAQGNQPSGT